MTAKERTILLYPPGHIESFDRLEEEARRFALHCLRTSGGLVATLLLVTDKGLVAFSLALWSTKRIRTVSPMTVG